MLGGKAKSVWAFYRLKHPPAGMKSSIVALTLAAVIARARAEVGPCRFDETECSCKMGDENQGVCWDQIPNDPLNCRPRSCHRGWTCACGGRTHVCTVGTLVGERNTGAPVSIADVTGTSIQTLPEQQVVVRQQSNIVRPCTPSANVAATKTDLKLGSINFAFSSQGTIANK